MFYTLKCLHRHKFGGRLAELESQLEAAKSKAARLEKEKSKMTIEIEEIMMNLDNVSIIIPSVHACVERQFAHFTSNSITTL